MKRKVDMNQIPRDIQAIYTVVDGWPDIIFDQEERPKTVETAQPHYMRRYTSDSLSDVFRAMGCQLPLNKCLSDWIFTFLRECPEEQINIILNTPNRSIFSNTRSYTRDFLVLSRLQFHRLVCAALHIHQFRKIRYCVDFRLALDFIEERRFCIILLSGAPGTGKSTIASLIASRMSINHILSTDSIRHAMRTMYSIDEAPILHKSTYECGDVVDPEHKLSEDERCIKGYLAQSDMVGNQLMNVISSFINSHASLIVEGVHLSVDLMLRIVKQFPNIVPFLIYIKKEDFHKQRFAVRAKYMTTDPSMNRYISNFHAIRSVQQFLSQGASQHLIPKIDNRNIDRSLETMHQTLFSYLKKLEGRKSMFDPDTQKLTFLNSVWKRRKHKLTSKAKTLKLIKALKREGLQAEEQPQNPENAIDELLASLPQEGVRLSDNDGMDDDVIEYLQNGTMHMSHIIQPPKEEETNVAIAPHAPGDDENFLDTETEPDPAEVTLTDFIETTDSELPSGDYSSLLARFQDLKQFTKSTT